MLFTYVYYLLLYTDHNRVCVCILVYTNESTKQSKTNDQIEINLPIGTLF